MQCNVLEARNQLSKLIDAAMRGEDVVIAKRGQPAVRLVKIESADVPQRGTGEWFAKWFDENPPLRERTTEDIEAEIREAKSGWD